MLVTVMLSVASTGAAMPSLTLTVKLFAPTSLLVGCAGERAVRGHVEPCGAAHFQEGQRIVVRVAGIVRRVWRCKRHPRWHWSSLTGLPLQTGAALAGGATTLVMLMRSWLVEITGASAVQPGGRMTVAGARAGDVVAAGDEGVETRSRAGTGGDGENGGTGEGEGPARAAGERNVAGGGCAEVELEFAAIGDGDVAADGSRAAEGGAGIDRQVSR